MGNLLEPLFGAGGARVAQFLITVAVVLVLIALVYWLVGHFSGLRIGGIGRGRAPRLSIVDALPIDRRRRLVLVRRDNVEHLILIGGPTDVVVEPMIARTRRRVTAEAARTAQPSASAAMTPAPNAPVAPAGPAERAAASAPTPVPPPPVFPPQASSEEIPAAGRPVHLVGFPPPVATPSPAGREPAPPAAGEVPEPFLARVTARSSEEAEIAGPPSTAPDDSGEAFAPPDQARLDLGDQPPAAAERATSASEAESPVTVSHLEEEMARLLDEITTKRSSS